MKTAIPSVALAAALATAALPAGAVQWKSVDGSHSALTFVVKEMGVPVDGSFRKFSAQLDFDPARPAAARASIVLDVDGIDAGSDDANGEVLGKAWFNAKAFPQARFEATSIRPVGENRFEAAGHLTIKGHTQDVVAPFTYTPKGDTAHFDGSFVIKRADYAIGEGSWSDFGTVANEIQVKFHFQATAGK